ncbi:MAG: molybdopterin-dependent oxidoreductase [Spirochaetales bacterium]|jgi:CO/xanthine dehydrogenase Mo-binding subunit|nr:molybdopterin-dependent oxidoreductase [Spirochaetales bacterium]
MGLQDNLFLGKITKPGILCLAPLASFLPHGRIEKITLPKLEKGYGVIGPQNIPGKKRLEYGGDGFDLFAEDRVLYRGQTLLLVYGPHEEEVKRLLSAIKVEYRAEMETFLLENPQEEKVLRERTLCLTHPDQPVPEKSAAKKGEPAASPCREDRFEAALPCRELDRPFQVCVRPEKEGLFRVQGNYLQPFFIQESLAAMLMVRPEALIFDPPEVSPEETPGLWYPALLACYAALGARLTGKPCRIITPPGQAPLGPNDRGPLRVSHTSVLGPAGEVLSRKIRLDVDGGVCTFFSQEILNRLLLSALGAYEWTETEITARLLKTVSPPLDCYSFSPMAPGFLSLELHLNRLAAGRQESPEEFKFRSAFRPGRIFPGQTLYGDKINPLDVLTKVMEVSDFRRKHASYKMPKPDPSETPSAYAINVPRGIGLCLAYQGNGFISRREIDQTIGVGLRLDTTGVLTIFTPCLAGRRTQEVWKACAARALQFSPDKIELKISTLKAAHGEGGRQVFDPRPALYSRNLTLITPLIEKACLTLQKKRFRSPLPLEVHHNFTIPPSLSFNEETFTGHPFYSCSWAAAAVELELNPVSLLPVFHKIWLAADCGQILDETYARSGLEKSVYAAVEWCLGRHFSSAEQAAGGTFPSRRDRFSSLPLEILFLDSKVSPRGLGELAANTIPGALFCALEQALGTPVHALPYNPAIYLHPKTGEAL